MAKATPSVMTTKVSTGTAKKTGKEILTPVDLREKVKGIATADHPHYEEGTEFEAHRNLMAHFSERGFAIYDPKS